MKNITKCPACKEGIEGEKFLLETRRDEPWYKFESSKMRCRHCETELAYDQKSKFALWLIGAIVLMVFIGAAKGVAPLWPVILIPSVGGILFYKLRSLVVKK